MKSFLSLVFAVSFFASTLHAAPATQPAAMTAERRAMEAQLDRKLPEVSFDGVGLSDVIDFLRDVTGANVFVDWKRLETAKDDRNAPITLKLKNAKFRDVLQSLCTAASAKGRVVYHVEGGIVIFSTKEGAELIGKTLNADIGKSDEKMQAKMRRQLPEVSFDGVSMADVLGFLKDVSGVNIDVDWDGFKKAGLQKDTPISAKLRNVAFGQAVELIFQCNTDEPIEITANNGVLHIGPATSPAKAGSDKSDK